MNQVNEQPLRRNEDEQAEINRPRNDDNDDEVKKY